MEVIKIKEYGLSTNSFRQPKEYEDADAIFVLIKRLILLNPGTYPNHPKMGVGLFKNWKFADMDDMGLLRKEIEQQITQYLPQYQLSEVSIKKKGEKELAISIQVENIIYTMETTDGELVLADLL